MTIVIERFMDDTREPAMGCVGELIVNGEFFCYTMEQPWRQNRRFVSCIPVGTYKLRAYVSPRYGETYALENPDLNVYANQVDADEGDRYACLIHAANWSSQLQGCIAPGSDKSWGTLRQYKPNLMVTNSRNTLRKLMPHLEEGGDVLIRWRHER